MIIDAGDVDVTQPLSADICIVGSGAAGISLALKLADSGLAVLLLEAGGLKAEPETQTLYSGSVTNTLLHSPPDTYRQRRFGGTTTIWGGRCMPFDEIDFEKREYIPHSDWPISLEDLEPYYPEANRLCEAGEYAYTMDSAFNTPRPPMIEGFESENFSTHTLERFSCPTDFGMRYIHKLRSARNIQLVLHANVINIQAGANGKNITGLTISTRDGKRHQILARTYVLATGGLETARLLLSNNDVHKNGLGNDHDVVGRYYMCHIAGTIGTLHINRPLTSLWHGYDISDDGVYCRRRIALRPGTQRNQQIGNFVARLHHPRITLPEHKNAILSLLYLAKPFIPYEYAKRLHGDDRASFGTWLKHVRNVCAGPFDAAGFAWHMLRDRKFADRKFPSIIIKPKAPIFSLDFHAEQQPNINSRITLGEEKDIFGVARINVDWRYTHGDVDTVSRSIALLAEDMKNTKIGRLEYNPESVEYEMTRYGAYGGHHIGTARMGTDRHTSVVNSHCRLHDIENLYVASSAVFPTSSQANPTLTIVALSLRLAEHLKNTAA